MVCNLQTSTLRTLEQSCCFCLVYLIEGCNGKTRNQEFSLNWPGLHFMMTLAQMS